MCYRDMTFCTFHEDCKLSKKCGRALTPRVKQDAEKWMKNALIAMFMDKPECWKHKNSKPESIFYKENNENS